MNEENVPDQELIPSSWGKYLADLHELKTTPYTEKIRPGHEMPEGMEVLGFVRDDPYLGRDARTDQQEARKTMNKCTCGKVIMTEAVVEVAVSGTYHRQDGLCHSELGHLAAQDRELREKILGEQQPEPTSTGEPSAHDQVIADLAARREFGQVKYGSLLQASNGRDNLQDAYEEILDLAVYVRNEIERRKTAERPSHTLCTLDEITQLLEIAEHGHDVYVYVAGPEPEDEEFLKRFRAVLTDELSARPLRGHKPYTGPTDSAEPYFETDPGEATEASRDA